MSASITPEEASELAGEAVRIRQALDTHTSIKDMFTTLNVLAVGVTAALEAFKEAMEAAGEPLEEALADADADSEANPD